MKVNSEFNVPRIEHLAVWAEDLDETAAFLDDALGWKRHPLEFGVDEDDEVFGGMELAFIDANGLWLELVQPTTEGPGMDFLREKGNGSLVELDFLIDDFDKNIEEMRSRDIELIGMDSNPIVGDGLLREWTRLNGETGRGDERLSYVPFDMACGTSIELLWEHPVTGVVHRRNAHKSLEWTSVKDGPRLDSVCVLGREIEKISSVYTDILRLERLPVSSGIDRGWMSLGGTNHSWINGNSDSIWIELIAPKSGHLEMDSLKSLGEGSIVELTVEISDIEEFYDKMRKKDIVLTAGDATPLPKGDKAVVNTASGDRYAYLPLEKSKGMRIMVFERADADGGIFNKRDRAA